MWMWSPCSVVPWTLCVPHCTSSRVASDFWKGFLKIDDLFVITACPSRSKRGSHTHTYIRETEYHFSLFVSVCNKVCVWNSYVHPTHTSVLSQLKMSLSYRYIPYNGKFWRPLYLVKRSESATYITWHFEFWRILFAYIARCETVGYYILLANLKFGDRLFNHQLKTFPFYGIWDFSHAKPLYHSKKPSKATKCRADLSTFIVSSTLTHHLHFWQWLGPGNFSNCTLL